MAGAQPPAPARRLLESSELTVARTSAVCGSGDPVVLRKHFHTHLALSPTGLPPRLRT